MPFETGSSLLGWYDNYSKVTLYVPKGTKEKYEATSGWNKFTDIVEIVKGDANSDDQVGIGDIIAATNIMANPSADVKAKALSDVNGDRNIGIGDIVAITNIMAGQTND